jgi:hypothetical protein
VASAPIMFSKQLSVAVDGVSGSSGISNTSFSAMLTKGLAMGSTRALAVAMGDNDGDWRVTSVAFVLESGLAPSLWS